MTSNSANMNSDSANVSSGSAECYCQWRLTFFLTCSHEGYPVPICCDKAFNDGWIDGCPDTCLGTEEEPIDPHLPIVLDWDCNLEFCGRDDCWYGGHGDKRKGPFWKCCICGNENKDSACCDSERCHDGKLNSKHVACEKCTGLDGNGNPK